MASKTWQKLCTAADKNDIPHLLMFITTLGTLLFSCRFVANEIFLIGYYGFDKVWGDGLYITQMQKNRPWVVSNGDIVQFDGAMHFITTIVCWFSMAIPSCCLIERIAGLFIPRFARKPQVPESPESQAKKN